MRAIILAARASGESSAGGGVEGEGMLRSLMIVFGSPLVVERLHRLVRDGIGHAAGRVHICVPICRRFRCPEGYGEFSGSLSIGHICVPICRRSRSPEGYTGVR